MLRYVYVQSEGSKVPQFLDVSDAQHLENIKHIYDIQLLVTALSENYNTVIKANYPIADYSKAYERLLFKKAEEPLEREPLLRELLLKYGDLENIQKTIEDARVS
jgi:hypothetical protein